MHIVQSEIPFSDLEKNLAVRLVQIAFTSSPKKTLALLDQKSIIWESANCLELAALAGDKVFAYAWGNTGCTKSLAQCLKCSFAKTIGATELKFGIYLE